eukprot:scaffold190061_cov36-Tisochrysis_lutea.AAC.2
MVWYEIEWAKPFDWNSPRGYASSGPCQVVCVARLASASLFHLLSGQILLDLRPSRGLAPLCRFLWATVPAMIGFVLLAFSLDVFMLIYHRRQVGLQVIVPPIKTAIALNTLSYPFIHPISNGCLMSTTLIDTLAGMLIQLLQEYKAKAKVAEKAQAGGEKKTD